MFGCSECRPPNGASGRARGERGEPGIANRTEHSLQSQTQHEPAIHLFLDHPGPRPCGRVQRSCARARVERSCCARREAAKMTTDR